MKRIRTALRLDNSADDSGISLVEVMVAMFIFAIISLGVGYTLLQSLTFVQDSRARSAAANIASQAIDQARATSDPFILFDALGVVQTVGGISYTVDRVTNWVSDPTQDVPCGASGGALQYKRVTVTVKWPGMRNPTKPVRSDTLIAAKTRISHPDQGTILVSVKDRNAAGVSGVSISSNPGLTPAPSATDIQGCSYVLRVPPGTYTISISKSGYVDPSRNATPSKVVVLTAGSSVNASFSFDQKKALSLNYATAAATIPNNLDTSLLHASDAAINDAATSNVKTRSVDLYPFVDGYSAIAGRYVARNQAVNGCLSPNPLEWLTTEVDAITYASPQVPVAVPPATLPVSMGIFTVKGTSGNQSLSAVSVAPPAGTANPGCADLTMSYRFGSVLSNNTVSTFALPYGSWRLFYTNTYTGTQVPAGNITVGSLPSSVDASGILTLDPRLAQP